MVFVRGAMYCCYVLHDEQRIWIISSSPYRYHCRHDLAFYGKYAAPGHAYLFFQIFIVSKTKIVTNMQGPGQANRGPQSEAAGRVPGALPGAQGGFFKQVLLFKHKRLWLAIHIYCVVYREE